MRILNKISTPLLLPACTALLLVLSYPKFNQGWLAWFALAPLAAALWRAKTVKQAASAGFIAGFFFYAGILYWIYPTMRAGGVTPAVSSIGLIVLSLVMSLEFIVVSLFGFYLKKTGRFTWPFVFAAGWALLEYGKVWFSLKAVWFPWFMLGYTQWEYISIIQVASLTGVYGLSAAVCFTGALAGAIALSWNGVRDSLLRFSPAILAVALIWGYGRYELAGSSVRVPERYLNVALLQPSIDLYDKWDAGKAAGIRRGIEGMLDGIKGADLIVWPENALPGWIEEPLYSGWLKTIAGKNRTFNIVGSISRGDGRHVSAFLLNGRGEITASYNKRQLVPFGEYVPMRDLLGKYIQPVASLGEFQEGILKQELFELKGMKLGVAVCYESIFPSLFAMDSVSGADAFVNITNDGWYLDTAAPHQHFLANIFRAVETRRPVARAANNGISAVIDPWGRVLAKKELNEYGVLAARMPVYSHDGRDQSVYTAYGRWFIYACAVILGAFLLAVLLI